METDILSKKNIAKEKITPPLFFTLILIYSGKKNSSQGYSVLEKKCSHLCKVIFPQVDQEALYKHNNSENLILQREWKLLKLEFIVTHVIYSHLLVTCVSQFHHYRTILF